MPRALNCRQFHFLRAQAQYKYLRMCNNVRCLSRGRVMERFVACLDEIVFFYEWKRQECPQLADIAWLANLQCFLKILHYTSMHWTRVSKLQPTSQIRLAKPFHPTRQNILSLMKKFTIFTKNMLIWWNAIYPETITLRKMSYPRTDV